MTSLKTAAKETIVLVADLKLSNGMTSADFQGSGNVLVMKELLLMSVSGPKVTGRQSLMTRILILSGPGDLLDCMAEMMR